MELSVPLNNCTTIERAQTLCYGDAECIPTKLFMHDSDDFNRERQLQTNSELTEHVL